MGTKLLVLFLLVSIPSVYGQNDSIRIVRTNTPTVLNTQGPVTIKDVATVEQEYDPNIPARAAFYSAILPGLGQAYNKEYWKIPVVYAGLGTFTYFYLKNDREYQDLRTAYQSRLKGNVDDQYSDDQGNPIITTAGLERAQKRSQRNKELSLLLAAGFYLLNIVDANVSGHLRDFNVNRELSVQPAIQLDQVNATPNYGLSLNFNF